MQSVAERGNHTVHKSLLIYRKVMITALGGAVYLSSK